jgi:ABC-type branched-subunit amino acid transport system ATPase component
VAFVGPNGVGKTTLLKMLTGEVQPDAGTVTLGTNLEIAVFDQTRARLDLDASLWDNLTVDPLMRVSGASDQVMVRGTRNMWWPTSRTSSSTKPRPARRCAACRAAKRRGFCWQS